MKPFLKLKHLWEELDMNQTDAAHAAGISESTFSARITGRQPFTMWEVAKLCLALHIPKEEIHDYFVPLTLAATAKGADTSNAAQPTKQTSRAGRLFSVSL